MTATYDFPIAIACYQAQAQYTAPQQDVSAGVLAKKTSRNSSPRDSTDNVNVRGCRSANGKALVS